MLCGSGGKKKTVKYTKEDLDLNVPPDSPKGEASDGPSTMGAVVRDLRDFLLEAELDHYYNGLKNELKVASVPQLKYVAEDDLTAIGMSKPEMRRLKKFYKKEVPSGKLEKFKRALLDRANLATSPASRTLSPSADNRISRPISYIRPTGKQIISSDSIEVVKTLGEGEFGIVQQGVWTTEEDEKVDVALKCLSRERLENGTQEFLKEAGLMQTIDHDNIVRMYGVVLDKENSLMLVTELAPMKSLLECLKDPLMRQDFPLPRLCDFAQQISDGMSYLESKRLIHRDLAARNILVFNKSKIKISDFGLSRALGRGKDYYQSNFTINLKLPIAWCAPECINYLKFTSASDVWAFGVTLWELFTYGYQPWAGMSGQQILDAIDEPYNRRLDQPDLCPKNYYDLMLKCWDHDPENRPTFSEMFIMLPQMRPTQVKAIKDFPEVTVPKDYIYYKAYDVISVLDKTPTKPPVAGLWKGALVNGKTGYFDPCNTVPFIEPKNSPDHQSPKKNITRKDSKRSASKKIRPDMISRPQNDLRHTGHIGYDGAIFGDVGFIGDNYDKLPIKTASIGKLDDSRNSINLSRLSDSPDKDVQLSLSDSSLNGGPRTNGYGRSWISVESLESQTTGRTDERDEKDGAYLDIDDDSILADFKMPDLGSSLDFGSSFMDEVLKALNEKESQLESANEKASSGSHDDVFATSGSGARNRSVSPPSGDLRSPPPLPSQPPRVEAKPVRQEPLKLQAKVKPMSTSDEKMMDDAINMANELASQSGRAQMLRQESWNSDDVKDSTKDSDKESGSESPRLFSKLKASIKRSPKHERKRTFSDSLNRELDDVPPEAQEAYNMLVVHGSVKEGSRGYQHGSKENSTADKRESLVSNGSAGQNFAYADSSSTASSERVSPGKSLSRQSSERGSASPPIVPRGSLRVSGGVTTLNISSPISVASSVTRPSAVAPERPPPVQTKPEVPTPPKRGEPPVPKPRPEIQRVEPTFRPTPPPVPSKDFDRPDSASNNAFDNALVINEDSWKMSEESLKSDRNSQNFSDEKADSLNTSMDSGHKSTSPSDASQTSSSKFSFFEEELDQPSPREIMSKLARESRLRRSLDHQRSSGDGDVTPNRNLREPQGIPAKSTKAQASNGAEEEVDTNPLRMLRGGVIPVRGGRPGSGMSSNKPTLRHPKLHFATSSGSSSLPVESVANLAPSPTSEVTKDRSLSQSNVDDFLESPKSASEAPALPPRSFSTCDSNVISNPLPLPPRNPRRTVSLNLKPRERKYPLMLDKPAAPVATNSSAANTTHSTTPANMNATVVPSNSSRTSTSSSVYNNTRHALPPRLQKSQSVTCGRNESNSSVDHLNVNKTPRRVPRFTNSVNDSNEDTRVPDFVLQDIIEKSEKYSRPFPLPHEKQSNNIPPVQSPLVEAYSNSLLNLPQAPPPPSYHVAIAMETVNYLDDNVFEPSTPTNVNYSTIYCANNNNNNKNKYNNNNNKFVKSSSANSAMSEASANSSAKSLTPTNSARNSMKNLTSEGGSSGASTFPRGFKMFGIKNVKCNLEQLGFYNQLDPFWVTTVVIGERRPSQQSQLSETDMSESSPLMLANYKYTECVSYEDLLDFALDREKNGEEVDLMQKLFGSDVTREDCVEALNDTKWDLHKAIKLIKLKQLLSIQLGDVTRCKEALLACDWNIQNAADYLLTSEGRASMGSGIGGRRTPPSPECVDV